jgi:hypothetical protein
MRVINGICYSKVKKRDSNINSLYNNKIEGLRRSCGKESAIKEFNNNKSKD